MKKEKILCISSEDFINRFNLKNGYIETNVEDLNKFSFFFKDRESVEKDFSFKQLIPYAIVVNQKGEILNYQRCGNEKRLLGKWSAGIGGHTNNNDLGSDLYTTLLKGLCREFKEETGCYLEANDIKFLGIINEEESEVGLCHAGVVFKIVMNASKLSFSNEIACAKWTSTNEINLDKFETWSKLAIHLNDKIK